MLKGRILGIFCWICLFSECFFEQQGCGVAVGFCLQNGCGLCLQDGCGLCLQEGCELLLVEWLWAFACWKVVSFACWMVVSLLVGRLWTLLVGRLWALLVLESFLEGFGMLESEYSLLEKRKQPARKEKAACSDRESNFPEQIITIAWIDGLKIF